MSAGDYIDAQKAYELAVLKKYAEPLLKQVKEDEVEYVEWLSVEEIKNLRKNGFIKKDYYINKFRCKIWWNGCFNIN